MSQPLLTVENLVVGPRDGGAPVVDQVSFDIHPAEVVALIGGSGSGKTTVSLAVLGHLRAGLEFRGGKVWLDGVNVLGLSEAALCTLRGREVAYVAQSAISAFNPAFRLERQLLEAASIHGIHRQAEALALARSLFRALRLPDPEQIGRRYPHQVSGGQLQRFMIAMALMNRPKLIVFDEPTSALDVTTQLEVLICIRQVVRQFGTAAVFVSHDLPVVAQMADRIVVMNKGCVMEQGRAETLLTAPSHPFSQEMLRAFRKRTEPLAGSVPPGDAAPLLDIFNVSATYGQRQGPPVIEAVSLSIRRGEICAVVGESGSGKTTLARVVAGLQAPQWGAVRLAGQELADEAQRRSLDEKRRIQIVFQSADTVLNPSHTVGRMLSRVLRFYRKRSAQACEDRLRELLEMVGLPATYAGRRPQELSGGEKQRVNLARALAAEPDVLICDEVTSALDVVVAVEVLALIKQLCREMNLGVLFISHDLASVCAFADQISVMSHGRVVEQARAGVLFDNPSSDATRQLIQAMPELRKGWLDEMIAARAAPTLDAIQYP